MPDLLEMNPDQARESVNTAQRFTVWRDAQRKVNGHRGSLAWHNVGGKEYLTRSYYDAAGRRRQRVEGRRDPDMEHLKDRWDRSRADAEKTLDKLKAGLVRQTAGNRALKLGRVPSMTAKIVRAMDRVGLLGNGIRVVGTNALYAYEAAAGVFVAAGPTATQDVDLLMDARRSLQIIASDEVPDGSLVGLLRKVDRAAHKLWLSTQPGLDPVKRKRDRLQAEAVAAMVVRYPGQLFFT